MLSVKDKIIEKLNSFTESELTRLLEFVEQLNQQNFADADDYWGEEAQQAKEDGFIGVEASEALLEDILNA